MRRALDFDNFDSEYYHGLNIPPNGSSSGGGAPANLQEKSVLVTQNGTSQIRPDSGYDGLSYVSLTTNVPERLPEISLSTTITQNTTTTVNSPMGVVLTSLQITTNVPANLTSLYTTLTRVGTTAVGAPPQYDGLDAIQITTGIEVNRIELYNEQDWEIASANKSDFSHANSDDDKTYFLNKLMFYVKDNFIGVVLSTENPGYDLMGDFYYKEIDDIEKEDIRYMILKHDQTYITTVYGTPARLYTEFAYPEVYWFGAYFDNIIKAPDFNNAQN